MAGEKGHSRRRDAAEGSWQSDEQLAAVLKATAMLSEAGGDDQSRQLTYQGLAIQDALKKAKQGNTLSLFMLAMGCCSLREDERQDIQTQLLEYHRPTAVRRVEKMLIAYRRGSLVASGFPKEAATAQVMQEFGCSRSLVLEAIAKNKKHGNVQN